MRGFEVKPPALRRQPIVALLESTTGDDVMVHALPGFSTAHHAGRGRLQADGLHLRGPFPIMIAALGRRALGLLPSMDLLMYQRRADVLVALANKTIGIQRELVSTGLVHPASEAI